MWIGNQKRYFILQNENRSTNRNKIQEGIWICAGLTNLKSNLTIYCWFSMKSKSNENTIKRIEEYSGATITDKIGIY